MTIYDLKQNEEYCKKVLRKIVTQALNTVSYRTVERTLLINLIVSEIFAEDDKLLWLKDLQEFLEKCNKTSVRTIHKYYLKDQYEASRDSYIAKKYQKWLDILIAQVRKTKDIYKSDLLFNNKFTSVKKHFAKKRKKRLTIG